MLISNLFDTLIDDFVFLLDQTGEDVLINNKLKTALVTNASLGDYEQRYITTLNNVPRGSLVQLRNQSYLAIAESITQRYHKYKTLIRHCNNSISITTEGFTECDGEKYGYDQFGDPICVTIPGETVEIPCIVDKIAFTVSDDAPIRLQDNQISVTLQDNTTNSSEIQTGKTINLMGTNWTVANRDLTKTGLLICICESA